MNITKYVRRRNRIIRELDVKAARKLQPEASLGISDESILIALHKMRVMTCLDKKLVDESLKWLEERGFQPTSD